MLTEPTVLTPRGISYSDPKSAGALCLGLTVTTENAVEVFVKGLPTRESLSQVLGV
jgi:hypothetical protein